MGAVYQGSWCTRWCVGMTDPMVARRICGQLVATGFISRRAVVVVHTPRRWPSACPFVERSDFTPMSRPGTAT